MAPLTMTILAAVTFTLAPLVVVLLAASWSDEREVNISRMLVTHGSNSHDINVPDSGMALKLVFVHMKHKKP